MNRISVLFFLIFHSTSVSAQSENPEAPIRFGSFQEVLKYADQHAASIKNAVISEQIAEAGKKEAQSYLYPSVNAVAGYNNNLTLQPTLIPAEIFNPAAEEGSFAEFTFGRQHVYSAGIQAQWDILNFPKLFVSETASIVARQSVINTEKSRFNTYHQLASTYYSILLAQESIGIYEENVRVSATIYASTKEKFDQGILGEAELNAAEIKQLESRKKLNQATVNLSRFYAQLQSQLNTTDQITVSDQVQNFRVAATTLQTTHPEIKWQESEVTKYESLLKQKRAMLLPNLSLAYQYNYSWATDGWTDFANANQLPQQFVGVKLNVPVFHGFSSRKKIDQSEWQLQQMQWQLANTKLVKQKEDELLLLDLEQYAAELSDNLQIMELVEKNDQHAENKYQSGLVTLDERLSKNEDLLHAQNNYLQSLAAYTLAQYKVYIRQIDLTGIN